MSEEQRLVFQTKPAEGVRLQYHLFPQAQRGGMSFYPFSAVIQGCRVTNPSLIEKDSVAAGDPPNSYIQFQLGSGELKLDGEAIYVDEFGAGSEVVIPLPQSFDDLSIGMTDEDYTLIVPVFVNPRRTVPIFESGSIPAAGSYSKGDKVIEVQPHAEFDEYLMIRNIFLHDGAEWVTYNNNIVFESPIEGKDWGQNNLPFNSVKDQDITPSDNDLVTKQNASTTFTSDNLGLISRLPEKKVYHKTGRPLYVAGPAHAYLRESASLYLANLNFTVSVVGGAFDSFTAEVDHRRNRTRSAI